MCCWVTCPGSCVAAAVPELPPPPIIRAPTCSSPVPVTDAGHILNNLQRALGVAGCPTDAAWPTHLKAHACLPVAGVAVPGYTATGMLVGLSMTDEAFPFTMLTAELADVHAVLEVPAGNPDLVSQGCLCRRLPHRAVRVCAQLRIDSCAPPVLPFTRNSPGAAVVFVGPA